MTLNVTQVQQCSFSTVSVRWNGSNAEYYLPSISTELSSGRTQDSWIAFAEQPVTRTFDGVAGVDAVCSVTLADFADMMNALLQRSFAVTQSPSSLSFYLFINK